jgi:hypothetical protein
MHRGHTTPVYTFGAIGYSYKGRLLFVKGTGKNNAFTQKNYLEQVLEKALIGIVTALVLPRSVTGWIT